MTDTQTRMINFMNNIDLNYNVINEHDQVRIEIFTREGDYKINFVMDNYTENDCGIISGDFFQEDRHREVTREIAYEYLAGFNRVFNKK